MHASTDPFDDESAVEACARGERFALRALYEREARWLLKCLDTLDERKRDCIVSAFVEGYTHEQIAQNLAAPVGTVKSWIRRGLLALKDCLS